MPAPRPTRAQQEGQEQPGEGQSGMLWDVSSLRHGTGSELAASELGRRAGFCCHPSGQPPALGTAGGREGRSEVPSPRQMVTPSLPEDCRRAEGRIGGFLTPVDDYPFPTS